jgi:hypothetical protein
MNPAYEEVSLENLGGGTASQMFDREMKKVVANILDANTVETKARSVTLTVTIKPGKDRGIGEVDISCTSKLAGASSYSATMYFAQDKDGPKAVEHDPNQPELPFDDKYKDRARSAQAEAGRVGKILEAVRERDGKAAKAS